VGHQFAGAALAAAVTLSVVACGGSGGEADPPPVLDNARDQVEAATPSSIASAPPTDDAVSGPESPAELPPPDPSTFEGANRVANLWVGPDGETAPVDVWGRRTFTNGPILLAENLAFGEATEYFSAPAGHRLVVVSAGAGPDGEERATMFNAADGEQITMVFTNGDDSGSVSTQHLVERGGRAPASPVDGTGLVVIAAANLMASSAELIASVGSDAFYVGDGSAVCRTQRIEADGYSPTLVGGNDDVEIEAPPGSMLVTLHPSSPSGDCDSPPAFEHSVDVTDGSVDLLLVYTRDGTVVEAMALPVARAT